MASVLAITGNLRENKMQLYLYRNSLLPHSKHLLRLCCYLWIRLHVSLSVFCLCGATPVRYLRRSLLSDSCSSCVLWLIYNLESLCFYLWMCPRLSKNDQIEASLLLISCLFPLYQLFAVYYLKQICIHT